MTADDAALRTLDIYLRKVRHGLRGLPEDEATEIIDELRSHALDRADGALTIASVDAAIAGLGPARELGGHYLAERMAERVEMSRSPLLILRTVWRLAGLSLFALFAFFVSLIGYSVGIGFLIVAVLKPIFPSHVGFWVRFGPTLDDLVFSIGYTGNPMARDIMGWWLIPFALVVGVLFTWLTWRFGLFAVRRLGRAGANAFSNWR